MKIKRIHRNYRVKETVVEDLEMVSEVMSMPVNQLVNECLEEGLIHRRLKISIDAMTLGREAIVKILEHIKNDAEIEQIGREMGGSLPKQHYAVHNVEPTWDTVLDAFDRIYSKACGWFEFRHYVGEEDTHRLLFIHDAGPKWTLYLKGYIPTMLKSLLKVEPKIVTVTDKLLELIV